MLCHAIQQHSMHQESWAKMGFLWSRNSRPQLQCTHHLQCTGSVAHGKGSCNSRGFLSRSGDCGTLRGDANMSSHPSIFIAFLPMPSVTLASMMLAVANQSGLWYAVLSVGMSASGLTDRNDELGNVETQARVGGQQKPCRRMPCRHLRLLTNGRHLTGQHA